MENLDKLRTEIEESLTANGFIVFYGYSRLSETHASVHWDCERYPDYKPFLEAARGCGIKLIVYHHREFSSEYIDDAMERLETADLPRDEKRTLERRLRELNTYEGFTCALELSFDCCGRMYVYERRTEWYDELMDILDDIDATLPEEEDEDEGPISGYFSRN